MIKRHAASIKNAWNGIQWAFKTQPNYKTHVALSLLSITASLFLRVSYLEFLIIITLIFLGLAFETINTAFEQTLDAVDKTWREDIKIAKDLAAGSMLLFSIGAAIIGGYIFIPKILVLLNFY